MARIRSKTPVRYLGDSFGGQRSASSATFLSRSACDDFITRIKHP